MTITRTSCVRNANIYWHFSSARQTAKRLRRDVVDKHQRCVAPMNIKNGGNRRPCEIQYPFTEKRPTIRHSIRLSRHEHKQLDHYLIELIQILCSVAGATQHTMRCEHAKHRDNNSRPHKSTASRYAQAAGRASHGTAPKFHNNNCEKAEHAPFGRSVARSKPHSISVSVSVGVAASVSSLSVSAV